MCQDRQEFLTRWKKKQEFVAVNLYFDIGDGRLKLYKNKIHLEIYNFLQNHRDLECNLSGFRDLSGKVLGGVGKLLLGDDEVVGGRVLLEKCLGECYF